jgi:Domain of unknown function (DUF4350)
MSGPTDSRHDADGFADRRLLIGVIIALVIIAIVALIAGPANQGPPLSTHSSAPDGAMALRLWLEKLGHPTSEITSNPIVPGPENTLFILDPDSAYTDSEALLLQKWVRAGHTLVLAGNIESINQLLRPYSVSLLYYYPDSDTISPPAPILIRPPIDKAELQPLAYIDTSRDNVATFAVSDGKPVLVSFPEQAGKVWVMAAVYPFTNIGLQNQTTAKLTLNVLASLDTGPVAFDESRHGIGPGAADSVSSWLFTSAPGWGILLALALTLIFLTLRGRRFGRAIRLPNERLRREPVEYIQAIANLFRRSGQRSEILKHYRAQLRRRLSERYAVDSGLDDVEMVKAIVFRDPAVDEAELRSLLRALDRPTVSEADLLRTAAQVDALLRTLA